MILYILICGFAFCAAGRAVCGHHRRVHGDGVAQQPLRRVPRAAHVSRGARPLSAGPPALPARTDPSRFLLECASVCGAPKTWYEPGILRAKEYTVRYTVTPSFTPSPCCSCRSCSASPVTAASQGPPEAKTKQTPEVYPARQNNQMNVLCLCYT